MKICFLITGLGIGGAERHLYNLVPRINQDVFIISLTNNNNFGKKIEEKGIKVYYLGLNKINLPLVILKFRKILKEKKPEVLDTYLIHSNLFGRIFGRIFGVKINISSIRSDYSKFQILKRIDKITRKRASLYILNSRALISYVHDKNQVPMDKIKILPNGIDLNEIQGKLDKNYDVRRELQLNDDNFIVTFAGRLIKDKNLATLIKAMKYVDDSIHLIIAGDGPERNDLLQLIKNLNITDKVHFLGPRQDVFNILNSSNVFILPSIREGMSNALLEAMALKRICIVSNIPQNKELIKDGVNGMIFNPLNEKELASKIMKVYSNKAPKDLGQECFNLVQKEFNIEIIKKKYENIIKNILT